MSEHLPTGGVELSAAQIEALDARWAACWTPAEVAEHLAGIAAPWCVAAGWALDLFRGGQTREHGDIEIAIPAASFPLIRDRFPAHVFDAVGSGRVWEDADFAGTVPLMSRAQRARLADLLAHVHPGHAWISEL